jgi:hypothetical protein
MLSYTYPFLVPSFALIATTTTSTMLPKSCLLAILAALSATSALTIPQIAKHQPAATSEESYIHPSLLLSANDHSDLSTATLDFADGFSAEVMAEMEAHMRDYKGWDMSEKRLISLQGSGEMGEEELKWVTEWDKVLLKAKGRKFMDV